jgi:3-dehydroquinate dehydratase-2
MIKIKVIHGPNLNLLGIREKTTYGNNTLDQINKKLYEIATNNDVAIKIFQSNSESSLINSIHDCLKEESNFIIINPAAYTHTSIAIRDALLAVSIPFIEVHISNTMSRESFRQKSFVSDISYGTISGFGGQGYEVALELAIKTCQTYNKDKEQD